MRLATISRRVVDRYLRQLAFSSPLRTIAMRYRRNPPARLPPDSWAKTFRRFPLAPPMHTERTVAPWKLRTPPDQRSTRYHSAGTRPDDSSWLRVRNRDNGEINYQRDASTLCGANKTTLSNATFDPLPDKEHRRGIIDVAKKMIDYSAEATLLPVPVTGRGIAAR